MNHRTKKTNVENKEHREQEELRAFVQALGMTFCVHAFLNGAVFAPAKLLCEERTVEQIMGSLVLTVVVLTLLWILCRRCANLRRWGLSVALALTGYVSVIHGGGLGLAAAFLFLIWVSLPGTEKGEEADG